MEKLTEAKMFVGGEAAKSPMEMGRLNQERVALKTIRTTGTQYLYYLKREFRTLQGLQHPNLVRLGERPTGDVRIEQPRGTLRGERVVYNLQTGRVESGGEGSGRVRMRILPRNTQDAAPAQPAKPAAADARDDG